MEKENIPPIRLTLGLGRYSFHELKLNFKDLVLNFKT